MANQIPLVKFKVKIKANPNGRYRAFTNAVDESMAGVLSRMAQIGDGILKDEMRTDTGTMKGLVSSMKAPYASNGRFWIGVGEMNTLDRGTRYNMRTKNPKITHGYWFNAEFGRQSIYRVKGRFVKQENPATILPLAVYKKRVPGLYMLTADLGTPGGTGGGMYPSRAIRRTIMKSQPHLEALLSKCMKDLSAQHKLRRRRR